MKAAYRFGVFEANPATRELSRQGRRIRLQEQPFRLLLFLLENHTRVVSRDELRQQLWAEDTYVEFDSSVRVAVGKLRDALGDDADSPHFVATIPRVGYRFVAPVEIVEIRENKKPPHDERPGAAGVDLPDPDGSLRKNHWKWGFTAALGVFLIAALTIVLLRRAHAAYALRQADTIVLADFVNRSGEGAFDDTLRQGLAIGLEQSPYINVLPDRKAAESLRLMGHAANTALTGDTALEVCQRTGSKAVLAGSIASLGTQYVISLTATSCQTGTVFAQNQVQAEKKEDVLKALGEATTQLRKKLGESLATIQKFDVPLEQATTPSLEALKSYSVGVKVRNIEGAANAIPYLKRAVEVDPDFALAYGALSSAYQLLGEDGLGQDYARKAYALRDRVTERERFAVTVYYYNFVTGEREKALENCKLWAADYSQDMTPRMCLFFVNEMLGRYEQALPFGVQCVGVDPDAGGCYADLVLNYTVLNRVDDAKAIYTQALARGLEYPDLHSYRYGIAFLARDAEEMSRQVEWASHHPESQSLLLFEQSETEAFYGHFKKARELADLAIASGLHNDQKEAAARYQIVAALQEAMAGNKPYAIKRETAALESSSFEYLNAVAAVTDAWVGNSSKAQKRYDSLNQAYPTDTLLQAFWLPTVRAEIELRRNKPRVAIDSLSAALPYEMGEHLPMLPAYVRGQAYLAAGDGVHAVEEFQKILAQRKLVQNFIIVPLAELGLARSYVMQAKTIAGPAKETTRNQARQAYRSFLDLWKTADPDLPIFQQAKAESAQL